MKLFIGGLSFQTTDSTLRSYFQQWGQVTDSVVMKDGASRRSRGFGFITYADPHSVEHALAQPDHVIDGRRVEAKRAVPRGEIGKDGMSDSGCDIGGWEMHQAVGSRPRSNSNLSTGSGGMEMSSATAAAPGTKIFVGGLHYETRDSVFRAYFEQFGRVNAADIMFNRETHKSRGFGFVVFESEEAAARVLQVSHHTIKGKVVEVKRAVPRNFRVGGPNSSAGQSTTQSPFSSPTLVGSPPSAVKCDSGVNAWNNAHQLQQLHVISQQLAGLSHFTPGGGASGLGMSYPIQPHLQQQQQHQRQRRASGVEDADRLSRPWGLPPQQQQTVDDSALHSKSAHIPGVRKVFNQAVGYNAGGGTGSDTTTNGFSKAGLSSVSASKFSPFSIPLDRNGSSYLDGGGADLSPFYGAMPAPSSQSNGGANGMLQSAMAKLSLAGDVPVFSSSPPALAPVPEPPSTSASPLLPETWPRGQFGSNNGITDPVDHLHWNATWRGIGATTPTTKDDEDMQFAWRPTAPSCAQTAAGASTSLGLDNMEWVAPHRPMGYF